MKYIALRRLWHRTIANWEHRGKTRLAKWYAPYNDEEKIKLKGEVNILFSSSGFCSLLRDHIQNCCSFVLLSFGLGPSSHRSP